MPQPANVHVDQPLTNLALQYKNLAFIADQVFPVVPVVKESDKYYVFGQEELIEKETRRAVGAEANEVDWDVTTATYSAEEYALRKLVPDRIVNNSDKAVRPRITTTNKLMKWIMLGREKRVQTIVQSRTFVTRGATPAIKWDGSSPTIEANVDTAKQSVADNAGTYPNHILMNAKVKDVVKKDSTVRNLIRYTVPNKELLINGDLPPVLWNLGVIIAGGIENTAIQGQTATIADIWVDNVLVFYREDRPSLDTLTLGYTLRVKQNGRDALVTTWREDKRKGNMIEVSMIDAEELVAEKAGYLITDCLA